MFILWKTKRLDDLIFNSKRSSYFFFCLQLATELKMFLSVLLALHVLFVCGLNITLSPTKSPTVSPSARPSAAPTAMPTQTYSIDDPIASTFSLDRSFGSITINFDRLVSAKTFLIYGLGLQSAKSSSSISISFSSLFNDLSSQGNTTSLILYLMSNDYARLLMTSGLGTSTSNTYLTLMRGSVLSNIGYMNLQVNSSSALKASSITSDTTPPYPLSFSLNLNNGSLTMTFSKPINQSTFSPYGLAVQSLQNSYITGEYAQLVATGYYIISTSDYNRQIVAQLGNTNLNIIKKHSGLCTSSTSCFLSAWMSFCKDVSGNYVSLTAFEKVYGMAITAYAPDVTPPSLVSWALDINEGTFTLFFSETVLLSSFNFSSIQLVSSNTSLTREGMYISHSTNSSAVNSDYLTISLSDSQLNDLKGFSYLCRSVSSCYLVLLPNAVLDMSNPPNSYLGVDATVDNPMVVSSIVPDTTPPTIIQYSLDMSSKILMIEFSEIVSISSFTLSALTLQSDASVQFTTESITFSSSTASVLTTSNNITIYVSISSTGFSLIKSKNYLGRDGGNVYLACTKYFVTDMAPSPNMIVAISTAGALEVTTYYPDRIAPYLTSWSIDMGYDQLILTFSEPMNSGTMDVSAIFLSSQPENVDSTLNFYLTSSSYVLSSSVNVIYLQLSETDAINLKEQYPLCFSSSLCYLSLSSSLGYDSPTYDGFIIDSSIEVQNAVEAVSYMSISQYFPDNVPPTLKVFQLDLTAKTIFLQFSEPVRGQYLNTSSIVLHNSLSYNYSLRLTSDSDTNSYNSYLMTISLSRVDYINIKLASEYICTSTANCFVSLDSDAVSDLSGNPVDGVYGSSINVLGSTYWYADYNPPVVQAIYKSSSKIYLSLYFDDAVQLSPIDLTAFVYFSSSGVKYTLNNAILDTTTMTSSMLEFNFTSVMSTLSSFGIGQSQDSSLFYLSKQGAIYDYPSLNPNDKMSSTSYVRDGQTFVSFRVNLNDSTIDLEYVVPVSISTITPSRISVISASSSTSVALTSPLSISYAGSKLLRLTLNSYDRLNIQKTFYPLKSESQIYISISSTSMVDVNSRYLSSSVSLSCLKLTKDENAPYLSSFSLDMGKGTLVLYFSESILLSSFSIRKMYLGNLQVNSTSYISLSSASISTSLTATFASSVTLSLAASSKGSLSIRDYIHIGRSIGYSRSSTFLFFEYGSFGDSASPINYNLQVSRSNATMASSVSLDTVAPTVSSYTLDMNLRKLHLYFSEAVNVSTNIASYYTLLENPKNSLSKQVVLSTSTTEIVGNGISSNLTIILSTSDVDKMMAYAPHLALSRSNSYLAFLVGSVKDIAWSPNKIAAQVFRYGIQASTYIADTTAPYLLSFNLSMQDSYIDFYFDEVINCTKTDVTNIVLQYAEFIGTSSQKLSLTSASYPYCSVNYDRHVRVIIGLSDLNTLKSYSLLVKSLNTSYIILNSNSFFDASGNSVAQMLDGFSMRASVYTPDTTSPTLLSFTISSQKEMTLTFDEPVNPSTIVISSFIFQSDLTNTTIFYLSTSYLLTYDSLKMNLQVYLSSDYDRISSNSKIFGTQIDTYLSILSTAIKDMSGNSINSISFANAIPLGPSFVAWDLDMNSGIITLVSSENISPNFTLSGIGVQNGYSSYNSTWNLTTGFYVSSYYSSRSIYYSTMYPIDLNGLKFNHLGSSLSTSYLISPFGKSSSLSAGTIIPYLKLVQIRSNRALPVRKFTADRTAPTIQSFQLNINDGYVVLIFDEPVQPSSIVLSSITLISSATGSYCTISSTDRNVTLRNYTHIYTQVSQYNLNSLKTAYLQGSGLNNLVMSANGATDFSGNLYLGNDVDHPIYLSYVVPDTTPPSFQSLVVDLSSGLITVQFNEVLDTSDLFPMNFTVISTSNYSASDRIPLTGYSMLFVDSTTSAIVIDAGLFFVDQNSLLASSTVATSINDSYIAVYGIRDIFNNELSGMQIFPCTSFIPDTTLLRVFSFSFQNISNKIVITLHFSKAVNISSFDCSDYVLRSDPSNYPDEKIRLSNSICNVTTYESGSTIVFSILNNSVFSGLIGSSPSLTYLSTHIDANTKGIFGMALYTIFPVHALRVGPQLIKYILDMNSGTIDLIFSTDIQRYGPFHSSFIGFYCSTAKKTYYLTEGASTLDPFLASSSANDSIAVLKISSDDLNQIKLMDISKNTIFVYILDGALFDVLGESCAPVDSRNKFSPTKYYSDVTVPTLVNSTINLGTNSLSFVLSEPLRTSSIVVTNFRLQSLSTSSTISYKLTGGTVATTVNSLTISLTLSDAASIKLMNGLCKNSSSCYLSFSYQTGADMSGNYLSSIPKTSARSFTHFIDDTVSPVLSSFDLDMNDGILKLYFSEPVIASTLNVSEIFIQSRFSRRDGTYFQLTGGEILTPNSDLIVIQLLSSDIESIKNTTGLARVKQSSYVTFSSAMSEDLRGNKVVPIYDGNALTCTNFVGDSVPPEIITAWIHMDQFSITFLMSEVIPLSLVDVSSLILSTGYQFLSLTSSSTVVKSSLYSVNLTIILSQTDMNSFKSLKPLMTSKNFTSYSYSSSFIQDTFGNPITNLPVSLARQIDYLYPDTVRPSVVSYIVNMDLSKIILTFSESVDPSSIDLSQLTIQTSSIERYSNFSSFSIDQYIVGSYFDAINLNILISSQTMNYIKANFIGTGSNTSYLHWSDTFCSDNAGNFLPPLWDGSILGNLFDFVDELGLLYFFLFYHFHEMS